MRYETKLRTAWGDELYSVHEKLIQADQFSVCFPHEHEMQDSKEFAKIMLSYNHAYIVSYDNIDCGFIWINRWEHRTARLNFAVFQTPCLLRFPMIMSECAEILINLKSDDTNYLYDCLFGLIESDNYNAIRAAEHAGLTKTGMIPNYYGEDLHVLIYSKTRKEKAA